jgi:pSer/pThr/pTyr-binding forkhead associated (FHA) protein
MSRGRSPDRSDRSIDLAGYAKDAQTLELADFIDRHGGYFLVRSSVDGALNSPERLDAEQWNLPTKRVMRTMVEPPRSSPESHRPGTRFYVYPVRRRRGGAGTVTVGRTPNNDVCIGDVSLSKSHAAFEPVDGGFELVDRGSRNGTFIGDHRLEPETRQPLEFGKTIQFGNVRVTYMPAAQFVELIRFVAS